MGEEDRVFTSAVCAVRDATFEFEKERDEGKETDKGNEKKGEKEREIVLGGEEEGGGGGGGGGAGNAALKVTQHIPVLVQGCDSLDRVLLALENGADLVGSNLPLILTSTGHALCVRVQIYTGVQKSRPKSRPKSREEKDNKENNKEDNKEKEKEEKKKPALQLWDPEYEMDTSLLDSTCDCHTCRNKHSRAYIHHLLKAHELLGEVLLYQHNLHQLLRIFGSARDYLKSASGVSSVDNGNGNGNGNVGNSFGVDLSGVLGVSGISGIGVDRSGSDRSDADYSLSGWLDDMRARYDVSAVYEAKKEGTGKNSKRSRGGTYLDAFDK